MKLKLVQMLAATAELMGYSLSAQALAMMTSDFSKYDQELVAQALKNVRLNQTRFSQAAIQHEIDALIPDGRPGADEAWAMYPHDEATSAVITNEVAEAMQVAHPLMLEGDKIAARMAFRDAYTRIVAQNKAIGTPPKWFASLGNDAESREAVLKQAVEMGRLTADHAMSLLPAKVSAKLLDALPEMKMLTKTKPTEEEIAVHKQRMSRIRAALGRDDVA